MVSEGTKGRFTLTGKVQEGDCSFSISNAQPADQGFYEFRFHDGNHKYFYQNNRLHLTVTGEQEKPSVYCRWGYSEMGLICTICHYTDVRWRHFAQQNKNVLGVTYCDHGHLPEPTISPVGELIAGKPITLTCTAHPAPQGCKGNITWGGRINIENIYNYEREDQAGKVTSISDITVTPSQREHNSPLTCTVTYSGVSTNSSITLGVQYAPASPTISNCTSAGCRVEVIEGTSLSLLCSAESNPPANLSWAKTGQNSTDPLNSSSGRLDVSHVTTDNGGDYMCRAMNEHGNSTASVRVVITRIWKKKETPDIVAASTEASMVSEGTKGRFTLTGKVQEGDCSFSISNAQPADQGIYEFRIEDGKHKYSYQWNKLSVSVTDLPEPTISPVGELIAGKPITLTCTAHPAPQGCKGIITWGGRINIENIYNYEREDQAGKVTSISDITVTPSQREHNSPLTCTVTYSGVSTNSSITLDVQYAPKSPTISNCTSAGCRVEVIEGTSLSLLCSAESNPPANLSWAKTGQSSTNPLNSSSGRLDVSHVTTDNGGDYMCRAMNKHGSSTASITVVIISLTNDTIQITGLVFCGIFVLLLAAIVITLMMKYKKKRRPPEQIEESKSSSPNYYEVVYSNRERRSDQEPSMSPNSPNEGESPDEDVQYVSLQFSKLKPKISSELQETLYSEVKRN
ncbi:hypothetical protein XENTR_v10019550 [Xenopus tropicalis]|nr:hypothetical protein XENTR_v10019550 [Xenopus tropicalis]